MFTTEEKVNLLKKFQRRWLEKNGNLTKKDWKEVENCGLTRSLVCLAECEPSDITQFDIVEEER